MKLSVMFSMSITATTAAHIQVSALGERSRSRPALRTAITAMTAKGIRPSTPRPRATSRGPLCALPRSSRAWLSRNSGHVQMAEKPCPCKGRSRNCSHDTRQIVRRCANVEVFHIAATAAAVPAAPATIAIQAAAVARGASQRWPRCCLSTGSAVIPTPKASASQAVRLPAPSIAASEPAPSAEPAICRGRPRAHSSRTPAIAPTAATGASRLRLW